MAQIMRPLEWEDFVCVRRIRPDRRNIRTDDFELVHKVNEFRNEWYEFRHQNQFQISIADTYGPPSPCLQRGRFAVIPEEPQTCSPSIGDAQSQNRDKRTPSPDWDFNTEVSERQHELISFSIHFAATISFGVLELHGKACAESMRLRHRCDDVCSVAERVAHRLNCCERTFETTNVALPSCWQSESPTKADRERRPRRICTHLSFMFFHLIDSSFVSLDSFSRSLRASD